MAGTGAPSWWLIAATDVAAAKELKGIIDPTKVMRYALQNASSVSGLLLTTEAMIADAPKKDAPPPMPGGGMDGMDM